MADIITKAFGGIEIAVGGFDDCMARVRDVDLGEWLGMAKPRGLRILDRVLQDGEAFASVAQSIEHWRDMMKHRFQDEGLQLSFLVRGALPPNNSDDGEAAE